MVSYIVQRMRFLGNLGRNGEYTFPILALSVDFATYNVTKSRDMHGNIRESSDNVKKLKDNKKRKD